MKLWRSILLLLLVAVVGAFAWTWLAADPGQVIVHIRGVTLETSVLVALAALLLFWLALSLLWQLVRWPFRSWVRRRRARARARFVGGLLALAEGDHERAERSLDKAAADPVFTVPARLAAARAAHERGAGQRALQILEGIGAPGERAALATRGEFLLADARAREALDLLRAATSGGSSSPRALRLLVEAALLAGEPGAALDALPALARSHMLSVEAQAALEERVLAAALTAAADVRELDALWSSSSRAQRRRPALIEAFARRSATLGQPLPAMDEIVSAERREWSESLAVAWGELGDEELAARLRRAEGWLARAPRSPALRLTLGRLRVSQAHWEQAEEGLQALLADAPSASAWELLGAAREGRGDAAGAALCYANALRFARGEAIRELAPSAAPARPEEDEPTDAEARSEHGLPLLPSSALKRRSRFRAK